MKDRNNPSNSKRTTGYCFRWFVSIAILTFLPMIAAVADNETPPADPAWETQAQKAIVGASGANNTDVEVTTNSGTGNKPTYTVKTAKGLAWIAWVTNEGKNNSDDSGKNYPEKAGFEDCIVKLNEDISLDLSKLQNTAGNADESWVPIGSTNNKFKGTFNGNNKTITDLSITKEYTGYNAIGLFGRIVSGSVNDLTVEGKIELTSYNDKTDKKYIAGIVGYSAGNINNCHNKCEINYGSVENNSSEINIGGIVGIIDNTDCSITNCSNQGKIGGTKRGYCYVGGIAGIAGSNSEAISNCFNSGEIDATAQIACFAGGIAGSNNVQLSNCYSTGAVKANVDDSNSKGSCYAGGIAGVHDGAQINKTITYCYSTGAVSATHSGTSKSSNSCCAGGIVGFSSINTTISNCLALNNNGSPAISITATNVSTYMGRVVGNYSTTGEPSQNTKLINNYASTLTTMPADYTYDKGTAKKDGADIYLEDNLADILDADISDPATSPWTYTDDKLPTLNVWSELPELTKPQQLSLEKTSYLAHLSNWVTYGQTANVGTSGTDVTVTSTTNGATYTVHTGKGLAWIAWVTNTAQTHVDKGSDNFPAKAGFEDCVVELANDISLNPVQITEAGNADKSWVPIGHYVNMTEYAFNGTFNGNNHTIRDLSITKEYYNYNVIGLFGYVNSSGSINNLTVAGEIALTSYTDFSQKIIGGIAGQSVGDIKNCHNQCNIDYGNVEDTYQINVGGVVGIMDQGNYSITNCSNRGRISGTKGEYCYVGGIVGNVYQSGVTFSKCFNCGEIDVTGQEICIAGGIVGTSYAKLSNCYSTGAVTAAIVSDEVQSCFAGGIAGMNVGSITNCYSTGAVSATNSGTGQDNENCIAGGIVGHNLLNTTLSNCLALNKRADGNAAISATATTNIPTYMGRIIGKNATDNDPATDPTFTNNYASTILVMPKGYTCDKGANTKDGADFYPEDNLSDILDAGQTPSPWVYTDKYLPTLDGLPGQPSLLKKYYLENQSDPDPILPDDDNDDDTPPVYYTVTIPAVEGATTDPVAGAYEVEAWDSFGFYLTLEPAYDQSAPVVTTDRGETLSPRSSDGKYIVKYVRSDVDIAIEGITANEPPVANAVLTAGTRLWTEQQTLCIHTDTAGQLRLFTLAGALYRTIELAPGDTRLPVPSGIYIARLNSQAIKILVP